MQHDFIPLLEKRGYSHLFLSNWTEVQYKRGLAEQQKRQARLASPSLHVPEGRSCPFAKVHVRSRRKEHPNHMKSSRAQGKLGKHQILVLLHWLSLWVITSITLEEKSWFSTQLCWSMCMTVNSGEFLRQQSIWIMRISTNLAALIQSHYKVNWIPTKISHYSLCPHQGTLLSNSLACDCFKIPPVVSWLVFWKSFLPLSKEGHQKKGMWHLNLWLQEQRRGL